MFFHNLKEGTTMKRAIRNLIVPAAIVFTLAASAPMAAQQWSDAQKEVWKAIEAQWELWADRDLEGHFNTLHPDFLGWDYENALPTNKESASKWAAHGFKTTTPIIHEITPVGIKIHGNVAFAHYYYTTVYNDANDKQKTERGRYTDILIKEGDRWLFIGWHGGETSED